MVATPAPFTKTFPVIVQDFVAAAQSSAQTSLDFNEGSVFLALAEATGGNVDWLQKLYLFALSVERLQTSFGPWVDTWTADYMPPVAGTTSPRLPAAPASGQVTFSSATPQAQAVVPVGTLVTSFDGSQVYQVTADPTNVNFNATIIAGGGYVRGAGVPSINVPIQALNPGTGANVLANAITLIQSSVVGVDSVTNAAPITTGINQETDAQLKARFPLFIQSLRAATDGALGFAITSLQQGLQYKIHENVDPNGQTDNGNVTIFIDDGSGNPPAATVTAALTAVTAVRAAGIRVAVVGATTLVANINMIIQTAPGYNHSLVTAAVQNAVGAFVNSLGLETTLPYTEISHVAYNASPGVVNVTNLFLNGSNLDLVPALGQTIKVGFVAVS